MKKSSWSIWKNKKYRQTNKIYMLQSDLCDAITCDVMTLSNHINYSNSSNKKVIKSKPFKYKSDYYIVVKGTTTVEENNKRDRKHRSFALKTNTPFTGCISKINGIWTVIAEDLDVVIPMDNLIECSKICSKKSEIFEIITEMN